MPTTRMLAGRLPGNTMRQRKQWQRASDTVAGITRKTPWFTMTKPSASSAGWCSRSQTVTQGSSDSYTETEGKGAGATNARVKRVYAGWDSFDRWQRVRMGCHWRGLRGRRGPFRVWGMSQSLPELSVCGELEPVDSVPGAVPHS